MDILCSFFQVNCNVNFLLFIVLVIIILILIFIHNILNLILSIFIMDLF